MTRDSLLPDPYESEPFTVAGARAAGVAPKRLRNKNLQRPFRGIRSRKLDLNTVIDRCRAYAAGMPDDYSFSHVTAARLYGMPLPSRLSRSATTDVAVLNEDCPPRADGVAGHRLTDAPVPVLVHGLRLLPAVFVWCQLASRLSITELVIIGDYLVSDIARLATIDQLHSAVRAFVARKGVRKLRVAVKLVRQHVDSSKETELRLVLVEDGLPEPEVNVRTYDPITGAYLGKPDLRYPQWRIAFEYEGDHHRTDRDVFRQDLRRRERFESAGWSVIRVTDDDLRADPQGFLALVRERIERRSPPPPLPPVRSQ